MDSSQIVTCPSEGCDYEGPINSVAAHYSGKKPDSGHEGGYEKAITLLEDSDSSQQSKDTTVEAKGTDGGGQSVSPTPSFPTNDDSGGSADDTGTSDTVACPECGETDEIYESSAFLASDAAGQLTDDHRRMVHDSDGVCLSCGGIFDV